ncbi:MAG: hypothetical protein JNM68_03750 [Dinghuibacter sp.]|nr:hypothetical protein [Dinghuibacter sp.]
MKTGYSFFLLAMLVWPVWNHAQNIGIGTTAPQDKLHVAGAIRTDTLRTQHIRLNTNAGAGKILTSDATGNASWQPIAQNIINGSTGFGSWGDCSMANISEYEPLVHHAPLPSDRFGFSAALSDAFAIIGTPNDAPNGPFGPGSASVFVHNGINWVLFDTLTDATGQNSDQFGYSVAISGNIAVVGAPTDDVGANADQGSASIFQFDGSNWQFMQKITDNTGFANSLFGSSVAISGDHILVGALNDDGLPPANRGAICFFHFDGTNWVQVQKINHATNNANDNFGISVSLDGDYALAGAPGDNGTGSVFTYRYDGINWVFMNKLTDPAAAAGDRFGSSVSVSGNYAIVGVPDDDVNANANQGSVIFYQLSGLAWLQIQKITDVLGAVDDRFGGSVSLSGNYAIVGAADDDIMPANNQGTATIYQRVGLGWQKLQFVSDPGFAPGDNLGTAVGVNGATKRFFCTVSPYALFSGKVLFGKIN